MNAKAPFTAAQAHVPDKAAPPPDADHPPLLTGADCACAGLGAGPVHRVIRDEDLETLPDGAILVAAHSSPRFVVVMDRVRGIVAEHGSVTGHMASVAREYGAPTLVNAKGALVADARIGLTVAPGDAA